MIQEVESSAKIEKGSGKPETVLTDVAHINKVGWFPLRSLEESAAILPKVNILINNATHISEQLRAGRNIQGSMLMKEIDGIINNALPVEKRRTLGSNLLSTTIQPARECALKSFSVGRTDENLPSGFYNNKSLRGYKTAVLALGWEEMLNMSHAPNRIPNLNHALFKIYMEGAFKVKFGDSDDEGSRGGIIVDLPTVIDGRSYLLCHREGMKSPQLYHDWEDNCQDATSLGQTLPQEETASAQDVEDRMRYQMERFSKMPPSGRTNIIYKWIKKHQDLVR